MAQIPSTYQVGKWYKFKPAAITYTFDDNTSNQLPVAVPLLDKYKFKSTFFVVTNWGPNWSQFKTVSQNGHEVASHTASHTTLTDLSVSSQDTEYKNSQNTINTNITNAKCVTIAYPNCNTGDIPTIQKYYIAGRNCSGQINSSSPSDFYNISSIICGSTGVNNANDLNSRASSAKSSGGWGVYLLHGIDNDGGYSPISSTVLDSHLSYINTNSADFWVGTFANVVKYIKERNALKITESAVTSDSLHLTPADNLDNAIYDAAVTVRRQLPSGWTSAKVYLGNVLQTSSIVTVNNVKYIEFDVVPDKGVYALANSNSTGCATPAPTVTSPVSYQQGATASALTATGTALKWYTVPTDGSGSSTAPVPSTSTVGTTTYYVSQTLNNCEGPRASVTVNITSGTTGGNCNETGEGAYYSGTYRNMFKELLSKSDAEVTSKVNTAFQQIFYGTSTQKLYYEVGTDMAYILDVNNNDVRSEGMSYGMMICVQLNKQAEFNKLWKWAKTYMQYGSNNNYNGYFAWQLNTDGSIKGNSPASDGEAYFITSLFFAANRWGNGTGIYNYEAEAQDILSKVMSKTGAGSVYNLFNANSKLITFVPYGDSYGFTDPSYNLPGFWELWSRWSTSNKTFWSQTPAASRKLLRDASHPTSGLSADYSNFDGTPKEVSYNTDADRFMYDAWRTIMNIGMDYSWFKADAQQPVISERYLTFFKNQGTSYKNHYDWNGNNASGDHSTGLVACNAVASLAVSNTALTTPFVQEFWNIGIPTGQYRYYDGMLYMLAMLHVSGNFRIWKPECPNTCQTPAPVVTASVSYELGETASALTATGTVLKWYTTESGTSALASAPVPNTSAAGTTTYYVSQTLNGCEGPRAAITVTVTYTYKIYKTISAPVIDGTADEIWNHPDITAISASRTLSGTISNAADLSGNAKYLWDNSYVYVYANVSDDIKQNESQNFYEDDGVEFYFDISNDKASAYGTNDVQYSFGWNDGPTVGSLPSGRAVTGITYAAVSTPSGYIIEARIPWSTLQGSPVVGQLLGIDFMINDDDDGTGRDGKLSWNAAEDQAWQNPSLFGTAVLAETVITEAMDAQQLTVNVYPNPANHQINVKGLEGNFEFNIVDNAGRPVSSGNSDGQIIIDQLEPGIYGLIIHHRENKKVVKLVVCE
jgi:oligosaccharide reducing-end xylanase